MNSREAANPFRVSFLRFLVLFSLKDVIDWQTRLMLEIAGPNLIISLLLGAAIGFERQSIRLADTAEVADSGIRTFSLVGLLGCLSAIFYLNGFPLVFVLIASAFAILVCSHYVLASVKSQDFGMTTEISFILTFIIGACAGTNILPLQLTIAIAVVTIVVLSLKSRSQKLLAAVSRGEVESFISFAILALVILPFASDTSYTLADVPLFRSVFEGLSFDVSQFDTLELLNPRKLWFIVVLITGIDLLGYVFSKFAGKERGFTMASFVGGFVSSTLTTQSLAQKSKVSTEANYLAGAAVLANLASFLQIFLLVGPLNGRWLLSILPTLIFMILAAAGVSFYYLRRKEKSASENDDNRELTGTEERIFSIVPALKFAVILSAVKIATNLCLIVFGKAGFVISSIVASFVGIDAILINLAAMAGSKITFPFALLTFITVNATNLLAKSFYCFLQGSRTFTVKFLIAVSIIIAASLAGFLFV